MEGSRHINEENDAGDDDISANVLLWNIEHQWSLDLQEKRHRDVCMSL